LSLYVLIEHRLSSMIEANIIGLFLLCNGIDVMYASESIYWIFSVTGSDQFFLWCQGPSWCNGLRLLLKASIVLSFMVPEPGTTCLSSVALQCPELS